MASDDLRPPSKGLYLVLGVVAVLWGLVRLRRRQAASPEGGSQVPVGVLTVGSLLCLAFGVGAVTVAVGPGSLPGGGNVNPADGVRAEPEDTEPVTAERALASCAFGALKLVRPMVAVASSSRLTSAKDSRIWRSMPVERVRVAS